MADLKTHLRELSVGITVGLYKNNITYKLSDLFLSGNFVEAAQLAIDEFDISKARNLQDTPIYTPEQQQIIINGHNLGQKIIGSREFKINRSDKILWTGNDTQKDSPEDLKIGDYKFSLKEDSFILRNMGLYFFLNSLIGSNYQAGLHIFNEFSKTEYENWFSYTWHCFTSALELGTWEYQSKNGTAKASLEGGYVVMEYNKLSCRINKNIASTSEYMRDSTAVLREKVFSRWINTKLGKDTVYLTLKHACSSKAGTQICSLINSKFTYAHVDKFLQIFPFTYYYAKTTTSGATIYRVPDKSQLGNVIKFCESTMYIPESQLNILTRFQNIVTGKELVFRNECRFSHGQFNGTPEAKLYVDKNSDLSSLFVPIV